MIAEPASRTATTGPDGQDESVKAPWHFKLLLAAVVIYLGWRLIQMIGWIVT